MKRQHSDGPEIFYVIQRSRKLHLMNILLQMNRERKPLRLKQIQLETLLNSQWSYLLSKGNQLGVVKY
jgi:hypothetical protein